MASASSMEIAVAIVVEIAAWMLMVVAMMFPLVIGSVRTVAARSLWRRRHRAIAGFLTGYAGAWFLVGLVASMLIALVHTSAWIQWMPLPVTAAAGFAIAAGWQLTSIKRRALCACHRTAPVAPDGWRADRDCLRYGWMIGARCLVSCWALMLACVLAGHNLTAMACISLVALAERTTPRAHPRLTGALLASGALVYAIVALR